MQINYMLELLPLRRQMDAFLSIFFCFTLITFKTSNSADSLFFNQTLRDSNQTLVSSNGEFELGFFSPSGSTNRYVGIWFRNIPKQTVVWVANRDSPLVDFSGEVTVSENGNILISSNYYSISNVIWSSNSSTASSNAVALQLLNTGNLVVKHNSEDYVWKSFDYPFDTLIPGMKLGLNLKTGQEWFLTSWKNPDDPSTGDYTYKLDPRGLQQLHVRKGFEIVYRSGPWNGLKFGGDSNETSVPIFKPIFINNENYMYYAFENLDQFTISRFIIYPGGLLAHLTWNEKRYEWIEVMTSHGDRCYNYSKCGPNGFCIENRAPVCHCPTGFVPKEPEDWNKVDFLGGCVRRTQMNCSASEGFRRFSGIKLPDNSNITKNDMTVRNVGCEEACFRNCSCMAYAKTGISDCVMWSGDLIDMKDFTEGGHELFIRMAVSDLEPIVKEKRKFKIIVSVTSLASMVLVLISVGFAVIIWKRRTGKRIGQSLEEYFQGGIPRLTEKELQLPLFDLSTIAAATNNFWNANKIGEGGFGHVYKGKLSTGQEIAVKKLCKDSGQGLKEFKTEIILIAKLQHFNLVRLLGCCIHAEERMLVYEYMPNRSLDLYIFNQTSGTSLDWQKRFNIIVGVARGLLYLHRDSRPRIIHRDLKASNILLDSNMNPKISDFGLARMFGCDETEAKTGRVMGTYGYMSPEYAIDGQFSVKSDVFSFGVLVLEIVSGRRNREFFHQDHNLNLLGHAWKLWNEGRALELLVDTLMAKPVNASELLRCIQVGLLCVQQRPGDRPPMSSVVLMLISDNFLLPQPGKPGFYADRFFWPDEKTCDTPNDVTMTNMIGR